MRSAYMVEARLRIPTKTQKDTIESSSFVASLEEHWSISQIFS